MAAEARRLHTTLVAGVTEPASATTFRNEIVVWGPDGRIVGTFEKVHRVPFGEYVPYRSFISHFADLSEVPTDAVPGHGTGLLRTPAGPLGTLVSFEVFYADRSRTSVRAGAELLIVPTNTVLVRHGAGPDPGGGRRRRPGRRDRTRPGPGGPDRLQRRGRPTRAGASSAPCWAGARC